MMPRHIAIIDIGKTNIRAILADLGQCTEMDIRRMPNRVRPGPPYPHLDVAAQGAFILRALGAFAAQVRLDGVIVIAHGATCALVGGDGLVLPVLDYECAEPDALAAGYDARRPPFDVTGSPRMAGGLNIGAQLHWLAARHGAEFARAEQILLWPQFWTWFLCGRGVCEVSYASSHGDLWDLHRGGVPEGYIAELIRGRLPPAAHAAEVAGVLRPELARAHGIPTGLPIHVGAHDSSLALVPHAGKGPRAPAVVMSTGTWLTAFAIGVEQIPQAGRPGVMASLDVFGRLVPNVRFMAGQARADILAASGLPVADAAQVALHHDPGGGPFALTDRASGAKVRLRDTASLDRFLAAEAVRGMTAIGARGTIHLTGPFADNPDFVGALEKLWPFPVQPRSYEKSLAGQVAALFSEVG